MIFPDIKANLKQKEIKELVAVSYKTSKLNKVQCKKSMYFLLTFDWYTIQLGIVL